MTLSALISLRAVREACADGRLEDLKAWQAAKQLPDLMCADLEHLYAPHELAAWNGQTEVLEWLKNDCGQHIDFTSNESRSLRGAVESGNFAGTRWIVECSGQPVDLTGNGAWGTHALYWALENAQRPDYQNDSRRLSAIRVIEWLIRESSQVCRILQSPDKSWIEEHLDAFPEALLRTIQQAQVINDFLEEKQVPVDARRPYLFSELVYQAVKAEFAQTVTELDKLLQTEGSVPSRRRRV